MKEILEQLFGAKEQSYKSVQQSSCQICKMRQKKTGGLWFSTLQSCLETEWFLMLKFSSWPLLRSTQYTLSQCGLFLVCVVLCGHWGTLTSAEKTDFGDWDWVLALNGSFISKSKCFSFLLTLTAKEPGWSTGHTETHNSLILFFQRRLAVGKKWIVFSGRILPHE